MPLPLSTAARHRLIATLLLGGCAVCVSFPGPWQENVRGSLHSAAKPPLALFAAGHNALAGLLDRLSHLGQADADIERLREENRALREALARQADDERHVRAAEADLAGFARFRAASTARAIRVVQANVLAADASPWRHCLVVDRGSDHGLRVGTPAVWGNSIVGTIVAVRPSAATVRLLNDRPSAPAGRPSGLTVRVIRQGDPAKGEVAVVLGPAKQDGYLQLEWLQLNPVEKGDLVVTSGLDPQVPPGLAVGEVVSASTTRQPLFYGGSVKPFRDLDSLSEVLFVLYDAEDAKELLKQEEPQKGETGPHK